MIVKKENYSITVYLAMFLVVDIVLVGVLLCFFSQKTWWSPWMVSAPNLFMMLGALYCAMMRKNSGNLLGKTTWLLAYKGIKIVVTALMLALYIFLVKTNARAFLLVTAIGYLVGLLLETFCVVDYAKRLNRKP